MISQLFSIPLRALIVTAALPTPPALGATVREASTLPHPAVVGSLEADGFAPQSLRQSPSMPLPAVEPTGR